MTAPGCSPRSPCPAGGASARVHLWPAHLGDGRAGQGLDLHLRAVRPAREAGRSAQPHRVPERVRLRRACDRAVRRARPQDQFRLEHRDPDPDRDRCPRQRLEGRVFERAARPAYRPAQQHHHLRLRRRPEPDQRDRSARQADEPRRHRCPTSRSSPTTRSTTC